MNRDFTFLYLGSKFIAFTVTMPSYLARASLRMKTLEKKFPSDTLEFIKVDVQQFMAAFFPTITWGDNDFESVVFEAVRTSPYYDNYVFVPPRQRSDSELTEPALRMWGIDLEHQSFKLVHPCTIPEHRDHEYMLPFYKSNDDLMEWYTGIMNGTDEGEKNTIRSDYTLLKEIKDGPELYKHVDTKFHCLGDPFKLENYKEEDLVARLYYSIKDNLPVNAQINPSYKFARNFSSLQQIYSSLSSPKFYSFCAVPDLMLRKREEREEIAEGVMYLCDDTDLLEIKPGGRLQCDKHGVPKAFARIAGGLHFIAIAKIVRALKDGIIPTEIRTNGLLVNKKDDIVFFSLKATIAQLENAVFTIEYRVARFNSNELTLGLICKGITETLGHSI